MEHLNISSRKEETATLCCLCKRLSQIHYFSHLLLLLLFSEKFVRAPTSAFIVLTCCSCILVKFSMNVFISFHCFSIPNKDNLIGSPSSSPSSGLALLRFFLRSVGASWLVACPGNLLLLDSLASELGAVFDVLVPASATCRNVTMSLHPRSASFSS